MTPRMYAVSHLARFSLIIYVLPCPALSCISRFRLTPTFVWIWVFLSQVDLG